MIKTFQIKILLIMLILLFLTGCGTNNQTKEFIAADHNSSWMVLLPGRMIHVSPDEEPDKFKGLYVHSITAKSIDSPNTRFGEILFDASGQVQHQIIGEGKTDFSVEDGNLLYQKCQDHQTFSFSHWAESGGTLIFDSLSYNHQITLSKLSLSAIGVPYLVPLRSYFSELSQRPDMAVILADESHNESIWIAHWMGYDHAELVGRVKVADGEEPTLAYQPHPEFLSSDGTSRLVSYRPEGAGICWVVTTKDKAHYLFGNVKKNFGGKAVLKRYVNNPAKPDIFEEEWVIEGGADHSFPFIAKFSDDWTFLWSHRWDASKSLFRDLFLEEVTIAEDGFYFCGTLPFRTGFWVGKTDFNGKAAFIRQYHYSDKEFMTISKMVFTNQHQLLLTGFIESPPWKGTIQETYQNSWDKSEENHNSLFLITLDQQGQLVTANQFTFKGDSKGIAQLDNALPLEDGSYFLSGIVQDSFFLMKTAQSGKPPKELFDMKTLSFQSSESSINPFPLSVILEKDQLTEKPLLLTKTILNRAVEKTHTLPVVKNYSGLNWITEQTIPFGQAFEK